MQIGSTDLCKDDIEREIKFEFFRSQQNGSHKIVGSLTGMTLAMLKDGQHEFAIKSKGTFTLDSFHIERRHSFLEYIFGGCEINLSVGIDFTLSNGPPTDKDSLHYFDPRKNQYL